jgi:hypothetical protein
MALASTIFQDDYKATRAPQHVHAAKKRQTRILEANYKATDLQEILKCISTIDDVEKNKFLGLLKKYEHLFDGTLAKFETSDVKLNLKEDANPYNAKAFPVSKIHHHTFKHKRERLVKLGVLKRRIDSEWAAPYFIISTKMAQSHLYLI